MENMSGKSNHGDCQRQQLVDMTVTEDDPIIIHRQTQDPAPTDGGPCDAVETAMPQIDENVTGEIVQAIQSLQLPYSGNQVATRMTTGSGAIASNDGSQSLQLASGGNPTQMIPVDVSGGEFGTANFGPVNMSATKKVSGGDYSGAHIQQNINVVINKTSDSDRVNEPPCTKHGGKCRKLTDSICLFPNEIIYESQQSRVFAGVESSSVLDDQLLAIKLVDVFDEKNLREAKHLLELRPHSNVVAIRHSDVCSQENVLRKQIFIAMERCSDVNLETYIKNRRKKKVPFNLKQAFEYSKQIIEAIQHIHRHDILHRDLKPSSILFSLRGDCLKICDFGLSKELKRGRSVISVSHLKIGSDGYRAPETYKENLLTKRADIFSLALVLHHLMSYGFHPFGLEPEGWNLNIKKGQNLDLSRLRAPFRQIANHLFENMLKQRQDDRPSIEEVLQEFMKLDWLSSLMESVVEVWNGTIKDNTGAQMLPCQLYCSPTAKEIVVIDGIEWNFQTKTINFFNIGALQEVTDAEPTGYIVTSSRKEVQKLTEKLAKENLMAWIDITKNGKDSKVLVLLSYRGRTFPYKGTKFEYPELFGFFLPRPSVVLKKLVTKQHATGVRREPDQVPKTNLSRQGQGSSVNQAQTSVNTPQKARLDTGDVSDSQLRTNMYYSSGPEEGRKQQKLTASASFIPWWILSGK